MSRQLLLPEMLHRVDTRQASTCIHDGLNLALHGLGFKVAATTENLVATYPDPIPGKFNIGVLHTALEGNAMHASYAPCSLDELHAKGYQYWALGHVDRKSTRLNSSH